MYFDELLKDEKDLSFPPSHKNHVFPVQFRDCLLEIRTNSAKIASSIKYLYMAIIVSEGNNAGSTPVAYCHFKNNAQYIITRNGKFAYSFEDFSESVTRFDWMLMSDIVDHHRHLPIIHASAVAKDRKTVIFVGRSGVGKSSLALLMGLEGWDFISDDIVMVDKGIQGAPRAFCLPGGLAKDLIGKAVPHIKGIKRGKRYVYIAPCKIDMEIASSVLPVTHIIFLEKDLKENRVTYLTPAMTLKHLIDNLFDTSDPFREKLDILIDVTEEVRGAQLTWCDMSLAINEVKDFVSSGSKGHTARHGHQKPLPSGGIPYNSSSHRFFP
jgi:hypothetical protein